MIELIFVAVIAILAVIAVATSIRVVRQSYVGIVERFGRYTRSLGPGVHVLVPFLDRLRMVVDMKETVQPFPPTPVITKDNVTIGVDTIVYYQVTDAVKATYEVANVLVAMEQLTITTLRNVVGSMTLEETLTSRDSINTQLRTVLDEATEKWGVRVTRVELKSIDPPRSIQEAMEQQMRADRAKRATVLAAEGEKQSAILRAEGAQQAAILNAEADQKSNVLRAEGDRQARALRAQGEAEALAKIFETVRDAGIDPADMLGYKYLDALPAVAAGDANKLLLLPTGASQAMGAVAGLGAAFSEGAGAPAGQPSDDGSTGPRPPQQRRSGPRDTGSAEDRGGSGNSPGGSSL
ncbi:MAG: SPFH domain-containing protein [Gaiellales bacterium]